MKDKKRYETKLLDCWPQMKELRRGRFRHTWEAHDKGEVVIMGAMEWFLSLCAGLGDFANPSYGPYTTGILRDTREMTRCLESTESMGYRHEICAPMRCNLGQLFLGMVDRSPSGENFKPDIIFQPNLCFNMARTGQIYAEHFGIPYHVLDVPHMDTEQDREYLFSQMQEAIEWMQRITGREYDDQKLIEALYNEWDSMVIWARICLLNQAIPAPLNFRQLWSLRLPLRTWRHKKETLDFYKTLYDEVRDRVRNEISAQGMETARLLQEGLPPFYAHELLKLADKYGAVYVGGELPFVTMGAWEVLEDGTWKSPPTLDERGKTIRSRDDALWALVDLYLTYNGTLNWPGYGGRVKDYIKRVKDWMADGVVFNLDPSCRVGNAGTEEAVLAVKEAGIPVCVYECEESDPRTYNKIQIERKLELFYTEVLGLEELS